MCPLRTKPEQVSNANDETVMLSIGTPLDAMSHMFDEPVEDARGFHLEFSFRGFLLRLAEEAGVRAREAVVFLQLRVPISHSLLVVFLFPVAIFA